MLTPLFNVSIHERGTAPIEIWKGEQESADMLQPYVGEAVQEAIAHRDGHLTIKFYNGRTLLFEPEIDGEWRFHQIHRDKIIFSVTWSDATYI